ncbi:hypothetical protein L6R52_21260 [Myxococcota bacterium]|nr:hypothetical protein [Myxococcota bacterium]
MKVSKTVKGLAAGTSLAALVSFGVPATASAADLLDHGSARVADEKKDEKKKDEKKAEKKDEKKAEKKGEKKDGEHACGGEGACGEGGCGKK